jgi:hypothetical protein
VLDLIQRHRERGIPPPIDGETLARAGVPESLLPRTLQALQTLDLINETGEPTQTFEGLRLAPETEFKKRLDDWLRSAYADVFAFVDPTKDGEARIRDAFRSYHPIGQQSRMVVLFQGLCGAAGLLPEKAAQPGSNSTAPKRLVIKPQFVIKPKPKPSVNPKATVLNGSPGLPAPLAGLLASLPSPGSHWTQTNRDKFMATFGTVLDFCFPPIENSSVSDKQERGDQ